MQFTPTVQHCSMATLIGLCLRVKLMRALPPRFKARMDLKECAEDAFGRLPVRLLLSSRGMNYFSYGMK